MSQERLTAMSQVTGVRVETILGTELRQYFGGALRRPDNLAETGKEVSRWSRNNWVEVWPSRACPACLAEHPDVWLTKWKLAWSFVCVKHGLYLVRSCPACGGSLQGRERDVEQRSACWNPMPSGDRCGFPVRNIPQEPAGILALQLQRHVESLLEPNPDDDDDVNPSIAELKRLVPALLHIGGPSLGQPAEDASTDAWSEYADARLHGGGRPRQQGRSFAMLEPKLVPTLLRVALPMTRRRDVRPLWREVVDSAQAAATLRVEEWSRMTKQSSLPDRHALALQCEVDRRRRSISRSLDGRTTLGDPPHTGLGRHVPAAAWPSVHPFLIGDLDATLSERVGRRFTAMSLLRTVSPIEFPSWKAAAVELGVAGTPLSVASTASRTTRLVAGEEYATRLEQIAATLAAEPPPIDYRRRRRCFAELLTVEDATWVEICDELSTDPRGRRSRARRPLAAAWVWAELTGGWWRDAPSIVALEPELSGYARDVLNTYRVRFVPTWMPAAQPRLEAWARSLLRRSGLRGPISWSPNISALEPPNGRQRYDLTDPAGLPRSTSLSAV